MSQAPTKRLSPLSEVVRTHSVSASWSISNTCLVRTTPSTTGVSLARHASIFIDVAAAGEVENAVAEVARRGGQALVVRPDGLLCQSRRDRGAALRNALPTLSQADPSGSGGLLSYSIDPAEQNRRFGL
jgi:hypothetical protein